MSRIVCWFSCGAASAVATKLTLAAYPDADIAIVYADTGAEHEDNERFLVDCERWFGRPVLRRSSDKYGSTWQVWHERRFLVGPEGALCTTELKKKVRYAFQRADDVHVFGYTSDRRDRDRAVRLVASDPELGSARFPLIERSLTKADCIAAIREVGIEVPAMYRLGYANNNCIGCPKGGMGYWNKIRVDFPEVFWRMAGFERGLGHTVLREDDPSEPGRKRPLWLDELDPARGDYMSEAEGMDCGLVCASVLPELMANTREAA